MHSDDHTDMQTDIETVSFWQKTVSHQHTLSTELPHAVEIAVVGGGLLGAAISYWLARAGMPVALIERTALAHGATGRNGGFVGAGTAEAYHNAIARLGHETAYTVAKVSYENLELVRQVIGDEKIACDYHQPGHLRLLLDEDQVEEAKRCVAEFQQDGFISHLLDRQQVQEMINTPLAPEIIGGQFTPGLGVVHSAKLIYGLVHAAQRYGARTYAAEVRQVVPEGEHVLLHTPGGIIQAGTVVIAVNAWIGELLPLLSEMILPTRGQALAYAPIERVFTPAMFASITSTEEYWQQTMDGSIILGGCRALAVGSDQGNRTFQTTTDIQAAIERIFPRLFPSLSPLRVIQRWAGPMAFTSDYIPIVDRAPGMKNVWAVGGFSGYGMPFGIRLGQLLAHEIVSGAEPVLLKPFRLDRPTLKKHTAL